MKAIFSALLCAALLVGASAPASAGSFYDWWVGQSAERERLIDAIRQKLQQIIEASHSPTDHGPVTPTPEPSSALVFGAGLLVASQIARKRRRL